MDCYEQNKAVFSTTDVTVDLRFQLHCSVLCQIGSDSECVPQFLSHWKVETTAAQIKTSSFLQRDVLLGVKIREFNFEMIRT